jgi:hypothetical protein
MITFGGTATESGLSRRATVSHDAETTQPLARQTKRETAQPSRLNAKGLPQIDVSNCPILPATSGIRRNNLVGFAFASYRRSIGGVDRQWIGAISTEISPPVALS